MPDVAGYAAADLLNASPDALILVDSDGYVRFANDRVPEMLGYDPAELVGEPIERLVPESLREAHVEHRQEYMEQPEQRPMGVGLDLHAKRADGSTLPVDISLNPVGQPTGDVLVAIRDVTEQREHQRQVACLREATSQLMDAETQNEVAHLVATAATDLFGYECCVSRLVENGRYLQPVATRERDDIDLGDRPSYAVDEECPVARVYQQGEPRRYDDVRTLDDGYDRGDARSAMYVPIDEYGVLSVLDSDEGVFNQPDLDLASSLTANAATILDWIRKERELTRQNERLDEFAGVVAHDIRNPLNAAQLRVDAATQEIDSDHLTEATEVLDRLEEIVEYTLTLARNGAVVGDTEVVTVGRLAEQCWTQFDSPDVQLHVVDEMSLYADTNRLQHIFENLFDNAIDHVGETVTVRIGRLDDPDGFYVEDDGSGVPADERERIFERAYTTNDDGTGFGLAIVVEIATAHGWDVCVTDGSDGGARFEITGVEFTD